jgi:RNA 2',3'-cyclic 3'-phosphodiesterase
MPRLFTGIEIPAEIALALSSFRGGLPGARWIDPENYHLTLRFIGDIDDRMADDVTSILGERRQRAPLDLTIDGLDTFGGSKPRAVFARTPGNGALSELHASSRRT